MLQVKRYLQDDMVIHREQLSELINHFGSLLVEMHIDGFASLLCFHEHLPENLRVVKVDDYNDAIE